jgi:hypothetical protein
MLTYSKYEPPGNVKLCVGQYRQTYRCLIGTAFEPAPLITGGAVLMTTILSATKPTEWGEEKKNKR